MEPFNTSGLKALFTYPFRQANWQSKLLILGLLSIAGLFIPVIPWLFVAGYSAELIRRQALDGGESQLPEWDDWSRLAMDGLRIMVVGFVVSLPVFVVYAGGMVLRAFCVWFKLPLERVAERNFEPAAPSPG